MFNSGMSQIFTSPPDDASRNFVVILAFLTPSFAQSVLFLHVVLREVIDIRHKPNITAIFLFAITHLPMILFAIFLSTDQQFIGLRAYSAMVPDSSLDLDTLYSIRAGKMKNDPNRYRRARCVTMRQNSEKRSCGGCLKNGNWAL